MSLKMLFAFLLVAYFFPPTYASPAYSLVDDYTSTPAAFFDSFDFYTGLDPTSGFVNYTSSLVAAQSGLIGYVLPTAADQSLVTSNVPSVYIGVDHQNIIISDAGRASVRITGRKSYSAGMLLIADILHMPTGCGTWSSLWMLGGAQSNDWPNQGEIDIIENVNMETRDMVTLHTNAGCVVANNSGSAFSGTMETDDCNVAAADQSANQGCTVAAPQSSTSPSFGAGFNDVRGGVYATEWTTSGFKIWFFGRNDDMPQSLLTDNPDPSAFGTPIAQFSSGEDGGCDFETHFTDMSIIFDTTFCGDWAGNVWSSGGCAASTGVKTCEAFVAANPAEFQQAYWEIRGLRIYGSQDNGNSSTVTVAKRELGAMADMDRFGGQRSNGARILYQSAAQQTGVNFGIVFLSVALFWVTSFFF